MLDFSKVKSNCTGCSACMASCPVKCIEMKPDLEGFNYPNSDSRCINCGACERVCPVFKPHVTANQHCQNAYAILTKNDKIWRKSASGGAFSEICLACGDDKTIIVGAAWDGLRVHHKCVEGVNNIDALCKSKYVASDPENVFSEIREFLKEERRVIFCGTPCQVAGLKSFLKKPYTNLLTIDLICHGVGSPKVFNASVKVMEDQLGVTVDSFEFRTKRRYWEYDHLNKVESNNSKLYLISDPYKELFLSQRALRPSCGDKCVFRSQNRQGDITIADFKGLHEIFPQLAYRKYNYSTLVTNSAAGETVVQLLGDRVEIHKTEVDNIIKFNPLFAHFTVACKDRDKFFAAFKENPIETVTQYTKPAVLYKPTFKGRIKYYLPESIRKIIYRLK